MRNSWIVRVTLMLITAIAVAILFRSARSASSMRIRPDSVEYSVVGYRLAHGESDRIPLGGNDLPSRYPPGFSTLVCAPSYLILGEEPGNPIYAILLFGIVGAWLIFQTGSRLSGTTGGGLASLFLFSFPLYQYLGREILTDLPTAVLLLLSARFFMDFVTQPKGSLRLLFWAGLAIGMASSFRPLSASALLPFLVILVRRRESRLLAWAFVLFPTAIAALAMWIHNMISFGSALRSGYQFWCAVPYDYPTLTFSIVYLSDNLKAFVHSGAVLLAAVALFCLLNRTWKQARNAPVAKSLALFTILTSIPLLATHFFYFCPSPRFYFPIAVLLAALAGGAVGKFIPKSWEPLIVLPLVVALMMAVWFRTQHPDPLPEERQAIERFSTFLPPRAIVISPLDPLYLHFMLKLDPSLTILPLSRRSEYADKLITRRKVDDPQPPPKSCLDHRCAGLQKDSGSGEAFPFVADENVPWIENKLKSGQRVYLNTVLLNPPDQDSLNRVAAPFQLRQYSLDFHELLLPKAGTMPVR